MKKIIIAVILVIGVGAAAFIFLRDQFTKSQVEVRISDLVDHMNGYRTGFNVQDHDLMAFFDLDKYDQNAVHPYAWIESWKLDNQNSEFIRDLTEFKVINEQEERVDVEFTLNEGLKGYESKGIEAQMSPFKYSATLIYDSNKTMWLIVKLTRHE